MKKRTRLAALALAIALCVNLVPLQVLAEGEGDPSGDDSSSEFVGSDTLEEIFDYDSGRFPGGYVSGNDMYLADTSYAIPHWSSAYSNDYGVISSVNSKNMVSLRADWQFEGDFSIEYMDKMTYTTLNIGLMSGSTYCFFARVAHLTYNGGTQITFFPTNIDQTICATTKLSDSLLNGKQRLIVSYKAATSTLTINFGGTECSYQTPHKNEEKAILSIMGVCGWPKANHSSLDRAYSIGGTFVSARYTHYTPQFVSTELLDEDGNTMSDEEKLALQDGDVVTVRATVKNTHPDAGNEIVYDHLTLVPEDDEKVKKYPTAGLDILTGDEQTVTVDGKAVTNASGQPYDVSGEGIPFGCTAAGNIITYKAKIDNPDGKAVTVGQRMSDDFFGSKQYSGAELIPAQPLTPADPEDPEGEAGKDYHYTRTSPNENGWNNTDVAITFYPGDFNQFYIKDPEEGTVHATLTGEGESVVYDSNTKTPVALQAENSENGAKSVRNDDVIKVDKDAPALTLDEGDQAVTLTDGLSGIWKLERYDAASEKWVAAETFALPTEGAEKGNGKASERVSVDQNGLYRAVDAAGNAGEATPVSFNAPPSATPTDPEAPALEPEEETDEGGLRHAVIRDSMSEYIDKAAPLYGGRFTLEDAAELMARRYGFASNVGRDEALTYTYAITQKGADVSGQGVDTTQPGSFVVVCTATDADGNTTTLYLTDTLIDPDAPPAVERQEEGTPPVGPPFDPLKPMPQPVIKEDPETGRYHAYIYEQIAEGVREPGAYGGSLTGEVAQQIFAGRYGFVSQQGDGELTLSPIRVTQDGKDVTAAGYDTAKPGSCVISQTATDSRGNKTTVYLTYTFLPVGSPPWVDYDPSDPTVEPGSELEEPEIVEDWQSGTKYATVTDRLVQAITDPPLSGGWLDGEELRAFLGSRYQFTSAQPDGRLKEVRFAVSRDGKAVEGIDTTRPGEYLIAYTLEDSAGNRTSLFLRYLLQEGDISGELEHSSTPFTGMEGADWSDGRGGGSGSALGGLHNGCPIHWLALLGALLTLCHLGLSRLLLRRREEDEEGRRTRRVGLGRALLLALMTAAAAFLAAHIRCGYDLPALLLWAAAIVLDMVAPGRSRREERAEG